MRSQITIVRRVRGDPKKRHVLVIYDVTGSDYQGLERALEEVGFPPLDNWWARLRSNWYQNLDINGRENANAPAAPCCNKPPRR